MSHVTNVPVHSFMSRPETLELHLKHLTEATNGDSILFAPSFVEPNAYWTSAEKALFFQSIARHSRWRPDLIAEDLGCTKSIPDIWAYIQLLAESSAAHPPLTTSDSLPPSAREMSEKWIAVEEVLANEIISNEARWLHHINLQARRDSKLALKKSLEASPSEASEDLENQKKELKRTWRRLDFLSKLNRRSLGKMDFLLQDSDDAYCRQGISNLEENAFSTEKNDTRQDRSPSILNISDTEGLQLSPASRRRLQKRLWARKKRCAESGVSPSKASGFLGKLKRGPKFSSNRRLTKKYSTEQNIDGVHAADEEKSDLKQNVLEQYDITRTLLVADGLDIFHLQKFAVVSRWIFDSRQGGPADKTTIAYDALCYLRSSLTHFLTLVIGKAIALRRGDIRQRRINEGLSDIGEIRRENVLASLSLLGQSIDKNDVIGRLYATLQSGHDHDIDSRVEKQSETLGSTKLTSEEATAISFSLLADLREGLFTPMNDENILAEDTRQWSEELAAEETLEKRFKLVDHDYETRLWRSVGQD